MIGEKKNLPVGRPCLRAAIPQINLAARYLDDAVSAHMSTRPKLAAELIEQANIPEIREWVESLWGKGSPYVQYRQVFDSSPILKPLQRQKLRMPTPAEQLVLRLRDGFHCRFCGIPLVRKEVRERLRKHYPNALPWGARMTPNTQRSRQCGCNMIT